MFEAFCGWFMLLGVRDDLFWLAFLVVDFCSVSFCLIRPSPTQHLLSSYLSASAPKDCNFWVEQGATGVLSVPFDGDPKEKITGCVRSVRRRSKHWYIYPDPHCLMVYRMVDRMVRIDIPCNV